MLLNLPSLDIFSINSVKEFPVFIEKKSSFEILQKNKLALSDQERGEAMKAGAVWHHGPNGEETCAIWKGKDSQGKEWYVCNTHRCYQKAPTLKGAIKNYEFVQTTS